MLGGLSPGVHSNLLPLLHIQVEIVVLALRGQAAPLTPVDRLIVVVVDPPSVGHAIKK